MADRQRRIDRAPLSTSSGFAICTAHNVRRRVDCCEMRPVLNADMDVIDHVCVCQPQFRCKVAGDRRSTTATASSAELRKDDADGGRSGGGSGAPFIIDASSTTMSMHAATGHQKASSGAAGGANAAESEVSTVFSVSFYNASQATLSPAAAATTSTTPTPTVTTTTTAAAVSSSPPSLSPETAKAVKKDEEGSMELGRAKRTMRLSDDDQSGHDDDADEGKQERAETDDDTDSLDKLTPFASKLSPAAAAAAVATHPAPQPRARPRYYDPAGGTGGGPGDARGSHAPPAKVCWNCGMPGHEKPLCPNTLCRTCHQKRGPYGTPHRCTPVITPSAFIVYPSMTEWRALTEAARGNGTSAATGEPEGMSAVRCVACNEYGHFDCSLVIPPTSYVLVASSSGPASVPRTAAPACSFCGCRGHTVFDCRQREQANPDYFERRHQLAAESRSRGSDGGGGAATYRPYSNYSSPSPSSRQLGSPAYPAQASVSSYPGQRYSPGHGEGQRRERDGQDRRDRYSGGDVQRRRYEPPSFSHHRYHQGDGGGDASSSQAPNWNRFHEGSGHSYQETSRDSYRRGGEGWRGGGGGRRDYSDRPQRGTGDGGAGARGQDRRRPEGISSSPPPSHYQHTSSRRGGGRRGRDGYDSGDDLF